MIFVDTNVILDVLHDDPSWAGWSIERLADAASDDTALLNAIILAECSSRFASIGDLLSQLERLSLSMVEIDERAAFLAGKRFTEYRRNRTDDRQRRVLPDFFIGAHASSLGASLLTRDAAIYRRYFPDLLLITPETHPDG